MKQTEFLTVMKSVRDNGRADEFFNTFERFDVSDDNRILVMMWDLDGNAMTTAAYMQFGEFSAANAIANHPCAEGNEFVIADILKSKLFGACDVECTSVAPGSLYAFKCIGEEEGDKEPICEIIVQILGKREKS